MASTTETKFVDDLDGSKADGTVQFGYAGTAYEIDLSKKNSKALDELLGKYIAAGRKLGKVSAKPARKTTKRAAAKPAGKSATGGDREAIRSWARSQGMQIGDRGRIAQSVIDAWEANA